MANGQYQTNSRRTSIMRAKYSTDERVQIGGKRSIGYAGKSIGLKDPIWHAYAFSRDAFTTSGDFIISPHSASKGLYVATCGNFHGWKFFPVIGKYVIEMLEGSLSRELADKWAWDREQADPALFADWPRHEMRDLMDPVRTARL